MAVFIAAAEPLPFVAWSEAAPGFHLQAISEAEDGVRSRFTKPHVYYLGAHTGCSCGFNYGLRDVNGAEDQVEEVASQASVAALRDYVRQAVAIQSEVELFASWEEDWIHEPEQRLRITPDWFGGERFAMPEKVLFRVTASV
ncbi:MAG: hypothetical protein ABI634_02290 [Acidobacteriota bacterium]